MQCSLISFYWYVFYFLCKKKCVIRLFSSFIQVCRWPTCIENCSPDDDFLDKYMYNSIYLLTGDVGDSNFMISQDVNYDPKQSL